MIVTISSAAKREILRHCAESPDIEACGLLFGQEDRIERAKPAENVAESPADSFEIDPAALFAAIRAERAGGDAIIGHYHSHPTGAATPSARDAAMALDTGRLWLIVSGAEMRLWRAIEPGRLAPVELALASPASSRH
ncbi:M67 family metallopeptidase [Parasphingopyxis sp.]|uniref:M67 family metallopeptidase n=1 Tax=Parasphingopyxis sp. TaxID=1920299 RepID=UPI00345876D9